MSTDRKKSSRELHARHLFRKTIMTKFTQFKIDVLEENEELKEFTESWKDRLSAAGVKPKSGSATSRTIMAVLGGSSSSGVKGVIEGVAAAREYHGKKGKAQECERAAKLVSHKNFLKDVKTFAKLFESIYKDFLDKCSRRDALVFANACFSAISHNFLKNELMSFESLLYAPSFQSMLIKSLEQISKEKLEMNGLKDQACSTHDIIARPVLYCIESKTFYKCSVSKASKFGFIVFQTTKEIREFEELAKKIDKSYAYKPITKELSEVLKRESFLRKEVEEESEKAGDDSTMSREYPDRPSTPTSDVVQVDSESEEKASRSIS